MDKASGNCTVATSGVPPTVTGYAASGVSETYLLPSHSLSVTTARGHGSPKLNASRSSGESHELIDLCCDGGPLSTHVVGNAGLTTVFTVRGHV